METYNETYFLKRWSEIVGERPDEIYLTDMAHPDGYSRRQVDELSGKIYAYLKRKGIGANDFVMIYMPRSIDILISALGVLKAGAAFIIMEDIYPRERVKYIMNAVGVKLELNREIYEETMHEEALEGYVEMDLHAPAFAVFTSGSTGNPKGVLHEYGNIGHIMNSFALPEDHGAKKFALVAPLTFVASMLAFMYSIGDKYMEMHLLSYDVVKNPKKLVNYILEKQIGYIFASPSMLRASNNMIGLPLKLIVTGSEPATDIYNPNTPILNIYCMSESGFAVTQFIIDKPYKNCPIGKCVTGTHEVFIIDENGARVTEAGVTGEICVENPYVRGYMGLPEETKKNFINGIYHTNDLGFYDENGNIVYAGRANDMIKINGNRVEPAEIETVAKQQLGLSWCAVRGFTGSSSYICLYYTDDISLDEDEARQKLELKLPYYMIPAHFMKIDEIPLTPTGKFNRRALPQPSFDRKGTDYAAPENELEAKICDIFAEVLEIERVGIDDDFYSMGGDSLKSMDVVSRINLDEITADDLFKGRTPRKIARLYLENAKKAKEDPADSMRKELQNRCRSYELLGVEEKYVEEMLREEGRLGANVSRLVSFPLILDVQKICNAVNKMLHNRPIWGTVFYYDEEGRLRQKFDESRIPDVTVEKLSQEEFDAKKAQLLPIFAPVDSIMGVARVFETEKRIYVLLGMSHSKIDGYGARIFWKDIIDAYQGKTLTIDTYYSFLSEYEETKKSEEYTEAQEYFDQFYGNRNYLRCLPPDQSFDDSSRRFQIMPLPFEIADVEAAEKRLKTSRNAVFALLTMATMAICSQNYEVMMNWTYQDRGGHTKENACGLTMKRLPLAINMATIRNFSEGLDDIKKQVVDGMTYSCCEWICEHENGLADDTLSFVYQPASVIDGGMLQQIGARIEDGVLQNPGSARRFANMVIEGKGRMVVAICYMQGLYSEETITKFYKVFATLSREIILNEEAATASVKDILRSIGKEQ